MTSAQPASCSVEGAQHFAAAGSSGEAGICERFSEEFYEALGEHDGAGGLSFALSVSKGGTISARISSDGGSVSRVYPEVSVDVMDRALDYRDLTQLAQAAAQVVKMDQTGA